VFKVQNWLKFVPKSRFTCRTLASTRLKIGHNVFWFFVGLRYKPSQKTFPVRVFRKTAVLH
jgi:hypothetical protein